MRSVLAVHGGAGTLRRDAMTAEREASFHAGLRTALLAGHAVLARGGSALDAVTQAVIALENDPQFNAGRGAVFSAAGRLEMDAAVMDGRNRAAGAVAGILGPRNPVLAARAVMERSGHVLLTGQGAMEFLRLQDLAWEAPDYFHTDRRWQALQRELQRRRQAAPDTRDDAAIHGTVGAVACDAAGNLAAATSTGGITAKLPGRVGDSPVIGAGTWADNATCAVSCTGVGEVFIRWAAAHEIAARMRHRGETLAIASGTVVAELAAVGGDGGLVAVDWRAMWRCRSTRPGCIAAWSRGTGRSGRGFTERGPVVVPRVQPGGHMTEPLETDSHVATQRRGAIAEIVFDRPDKRNAITVAMYTALADALAAAEADSAVRVVLFHGRGGAFTAGNDLGDFIANPPDGPESPVFRFLRGLAGARKPLVAAVDGPAVGIGTTMLLHCDLVLAADTARFALPFINLGLVPEAASSLLLPRLAGYQRAAELFFLGEPFDAATAQSIGLVGRVLPATDLLVAARALADRLAAKPPQALMATKALLKSSSATVAERMAEEAAVFACQLQSAELKEAVAAFFEKRAAAPG